jgi:hypothetical protein
MKKIFICNILLVFCLFLCNCKKEEETPSLPNPGFVPVHSPCDTSYGYASANKLTAGWKAGVICRKTSASGENFWVLELRTCSTNDGSEREKVYFGRIPDANPVQLFQIHKTQNSIPNGTVTSGYSTFASDGDVLEDFYYTDTLLSTNYLRIETWDSLTKRVSGSFQVSFGIKEPRRNLQNPKKVTFSSGKFWAKLPE